jgi:phage repressor protein C with HTH and peptisase S24 domain
MLCAKDHSELNCAKKLKKLAQLLWSKKGWVLNKFGTLKASRVNAVMSAWKSGEYVIDPDDYDWVDASANHPAATHIQSVRIVSAISAMSATHDIAEADDANDGRPSSHDDGHDDIDDEHSDSEAP